MRSITIPFRIPLQARLFLPAEMNNWLLPIHMALVALREGCFCKEHADVLGHAFDLACVDMLMPGKGDRRSIERIGKAGMALGIVRTWSSLGVDAHPGNDVMRDLQAGVMLVDRYFRTWTTTRKWLAEETLKLMKQEDMGDFLPAASTNG